LNESAPTLNTPGAALFRRTSSVFEAVLAVRLRL
jgi:hypothetical protein